MALDRLAEINKKYGLGYIEEKKTKPSLWETTKKIAKPAIRAALPVPWLGAAGVPTKTVAPYAKEFVKGAKRTILGLPQPMGALVQEAGERIEREKPLDSFIMSGFASMQSPFTSAKKQAKVKEEAKELAGMGKGIIEANKKFIAEKFPDIGPPETGGLKGFMYDLGSGLTSLGAALGITYLTKTPHAAAALFGFYQKGGVYQMATESGMDPKKSSDLASIAGVIEGGLEYLGLNYFLKKFGGLLPTMFFRSGTEALQEWLQTTGENIVVKFGGIDKARKIYEGAGRSALIGFVLGAPTSVSISMAERTGLIKEMEDVGISPKEAKEMVGEIIKAQRSGIQDILTSEAGFARIGKEGIPSKPKIPLSKPKIVPSKVEEKLVSVKPEITKPSVLKKAEVKKVIRRTTGQIKVGELIREPVALKAGMKKAEQAARKAFVIGKEAMLPKIESLYAKIQQTKDVAEKKHLELKLQQNFEDAMDELATQMYVGKKVAETKRIGEERLAFQKLKTVEKIQKLKERYAEVARRKKGREALKAETNKMIADINKLPTQNLPLDYKDKIEEIKAPFDLKKRLTRTLARRDSMIDFVERQKELGIEINIPQNQLDMLEKISLNIMTVDDLREVHEVLMRLQHHGRLKNKLLTTLKHREFNEVVEDGVGNILKGDGLKEESSVIRGLRDSSPAFRDKSLNALKWYIAMHLRTERIANMMDDWKEGTNTKAIFIPLAEAETSKLESQEKSLKRITDIHKGVKIGELLTKKYNIGRFQGMTKDMAMFIYANSFNDANRAHLYGSGITDADIDAIAESLTAEEKAAVEDTIRYYDQEQWPALDKVYSENEGVHLGKEYSYFPIMNLEDISSTEAIKQDIERRAYVRKAGVSKGFTKERVDSKKGFRKFSYFDTVYKNWQQVEHYKAFSGAIKDVSKYLYSPDVKAAIRQKYGEPIFKELDQWLKDASYGGSRQTIGALNKLSSWIRTNFVTAVLGYNLLTVAKQPVSFIQGAAMIGVDNATAGVGEFLMNPRRAIRIVYGKSVLLKNRAFNQERELREIMQGRGLARKLGQMDIKNPKELYRMVKEGSMWPILKADQTTVVSLWLGAYRDVIRTGRVDGDVVPIADLEARARAYADRVIRRTQPMGGIIHLAGVFRGQEFQKLYTIFKNQLNQNFNLTYELYSDFGRQAKTMGSMKDFVRGNILYIILPALLIGMISRKRTPESLKEFAFDVVDQLTGSFFILSHLVSAYTRKWGTINPIDTMIKEAEMAARAKKMPTKIKYAGRIAGKLVGFPYVAAERIFKGQPFGKAKPRSKSKDRLAELNKKYKLGGYVGDSTERLRTLNKKYGL